MANDRIIADAWRLGQVVAHIHNFDFDNYIENLKKNPGVIGKDAHALTLKLVQEMKKLKPLAAEFKKGADKFTEIINNANKN